MSSKTAIVDKKYVKSGRNGLRPIRIYTGSLILYTNPDGTVTTQPSTNWNREAARELGHLVNGD